MNDLWPEGADNSEKSKEDEGIPPFRSDQIFHPNR
jgi:hypothetical protein